jgi:hypothetical protein
MGKRLNKFSRKPATPSPPNPFAPETTETNFDPQVHPRQAYVAMSELGANYDKLAQLFNVKRYRIDEWIERYPLLREAIRAGREVWDSGMAERTLYHRAMGYEYEERCVSEIEFDTYAIEQSEDGTKWAVMVGATGKPMKVKIPAKRTSTWYRKHPPDVTALIFWLKNRMPERWRDVRAVDIRAHANNAPFANEIAQIDWDKVAEEIGIDGLQQLRLLMGRIAAVGGVAKRTIGYPSPAEINGRGGPIPGDNAIPAGAGRAA